MNTGGQNRHGYALNRHGYGHFRHGYELLPGFWGDIVFLDSDKPLYNSEYI